MNTSKLSQLFKHLHQHYGQIDWWPASSPFEVMIGAILSQNTSWHNVELAIKRIKEANALDPEKILIQPATQLQYLIKPAGFYRQKARTLRQFCIWLITHNQKNELESLDTSTLRNMLVNIKGIGPETADDIILYAFKRPTVIVDAYTRRFFSRLKWISGNEKYNALQKTITEAAPIDAEHLSQFHALIVTHCQRYCMKKPSCQNCPLKSSCITGLSRHSCHAWDNNENSPFRYLPTAVSA